MNLQPFFEWCDATALGAFVRGNTWAFPLTETFHIMALAVLLGILFLIDLKLLGVKAITYDPKRMAKELNGYMNWSIVIILITGILLFLSEAVKAYQNAAFMPKVEMLALALLFHYTGHRKAITAEVTPSWAPVAGGLSLLLWFGTGAAGRAIGFV
jgi:hypothetical protein